MTFTSLQFYAFFPIVYLIFNFTADRWRWLVLLIASYGFYAFFKAPYLLAVLLMVTWISYACGLRIASYQDEADRKRWLQIGVIACVVILALLKYIPILESQTNNFFGLSSTLSKTIISIGVSYFSFQAISYLADIYLEIEEPEKHFGVYALYMAFFPKLLQGPIERAGDLISQLKNKYVFNYDNTRSGMVLFAFGLFKKLVIANSLSELVDPVYNNVHAYSGSTLLFVTYCYYFQLFFDFSGYTDMARGSARIFNISLTENFNNPFMANSVADFWRRWHISFSRWILDYIFKPLQMAWREYKGIGTACALVVTFLVSGLWHGASWCFVVWGLLHGIYMGFSVVFRQSLNRFHKSIGAISLRGLKIWQIVITFNLVSFAWIFFRSKSLSDAVYVSKSILLSPIQKVDITEALSVLESFGKKEFVLVIVMLIMALGINMNYQRLHFYRRNVAVRWCGYLLLVLVLLAFARFHSASEYIYMSF